MQFLKAKRFTLLLLAVLFALVACDYQPPVFVTATPDGIPIETVEPSITPSLAVTPTVNKATGTPVPHHTPPPIVTRPTATDEPTPTQEAVQRDCNRISTHAQVIDDYTYYKQFHQRIVPCSLLIMDDSEKALDMMRTLPDTLIIYRMYHWSDGDQCRVVDPVAQVDDYIRVMTHKAAEMGLPANSYQRIALYGCSNEPSIGTDTALRQVLNAEIRFMEYARSRGITVVSGNWAVGTIQEHHIEQGFFHDYLWALANGQHYLGAHEYTTFFLPFGVGAYPLECLRDVNCVQPSNWVTADYIRPARWFPAQSTVENTAGLPFGELMMAGSLYGYQPNAQATNGFLPPYWHLFRSLWLDIYAIENSIPRPTKILTEAFHDRLDDLRRLDSQGINNVEWLQQRYGMGEYYSDIRGTPSHCRLYVQFYYVGQSCAQSVMTMWEWWDSVADETYHSANVFTWTNNDMWSPFDIDGSQTVLNNRELHRLLEQYAVTVSGS